MLTLSSMEMVPKSMQDLGHTKYNCTKNQHIHTREDKISQIHGSEMRERD